MGTRESRAAMGPAPRTSGEDTSRVLQAHRQSAYDRVTDALRSAGSQVRETRDGQAQAQCPAHNDRGPSLSLTRIEGQTLVYCHAGCATDDVTAALGLSMADLFDTSSGVAYRYDNGRTVIRSTSKTFHQKGATKGTGQLYRHAKVLEAVANATTVYVVEGEKDVHAMEAIGQVATCSPMGAGKWPKVDPSPLHGANVVIVTDKDDPGERHARDIVESLEGKARSVRVVHARVGKDAADHIAAGHGVDDFDDHQLDVEPPVSLHELAVRAELNKLRSRAEAQVRFALEQSGETKLAPLTGLTAFLAVPDDDVTYRVDQLWPTGGRVVLAAQHKAGKTTLTGNLIRALADGTPFLDTYQVARARRVVLIDNELDERMLRRWLRDHGIVSTDRVDVLTLRGKLSSFAILDPSTRARWADHIGRADVLVFDCLRPALDALGLSEDKDAGRFLEALDELTHQAGIPESLTVHHMGHSGERSRGDSRILDWPDALWKLVKDAEDDDTSPGAVARYFSAYGRDVDVSQSLLGFDPLSRRLHIAGGSRSDHASRTALPDLLQVLAEHGGPASGRQVEALMADSPHAQKVVRAALKLAVADGYVTVTTGPRNAKLHKLTDSSAAVRQSASPVRQRGGVECVSASIGRTALTLPEQPGPASALADALNCPTCTHLAEQGITSGCADHYAGPVAS